MKSSPLSTLQATRKATRETSRQALIEQLSRDFSGRGIGKRRQSRFFHSLGWVLAVALAAGLKRMLDVFVAILALFIFAPVFAISGTVARSKGGGIVHSERLGRWGRTFPLYSFRFGSSLDQSFLAGLPGLLNVLRGDMSFIGPRAVAPDEAPGERGAWRRYQVRPGWLGLWWIRRRASIDYSTETDVDAEYVENQSFQGDLGIALRALPAAFFGAGGSVAPEQVHLLGIAIDNLTMEEAIHEIVSKSDSTRPSQLSFVNADCVNIAARQADYMNVLRASDLVLGDGIGIRLAGRILNTNIRQNVNGTDLFPLLCAALNNLENPADGGGLYLLGGRPGVPEAVAAWVTRNYPNVVISGLRNGYFEAHEEEQVIGAIRESGAKILLVAFGAPKQELWIRRHLSRTGVGIAMGVGGLFDFYSGRIARAPVWMRELGIEWLYRFLQEPRRMWRRYFVGNFVFLYRVFRYRFRSGHREQED